MGRARLALPLLLLAAAAPARAGDPPPPRPLPEEPPHTADITGAEFLWAGAWLSDDAREGRETGTDGCRAAAKWLQARFNAMGLQEIEGAPGFLRPWALPGGTPVPEGCGLAVLREGLPPREFALGRDFVVLEGGAAPEVEAPAAFAGYSITAPEFSYDDFAGGAAKGKVAVAFRHEPRERDGKARWNGDRMTRHSWFPAKVAAARAAGAAALVIVNDPLNHEEDRLDSSLLGRGDPGMPVLLASRAFAEEVLKGSGKSPRDLQKAIDDADAPFAADLGPVRVRVRVKLASSSSENVAGAIRGSDPALRDEWVVVGAHYDHVGTGRSGGLDRSQVGRIHNGADDNASGTAALLEIAEHFALGGAKTRRSLLFVAFSGEEEGLLGSRAFVEGGPIPKERIVAMVNMDMVGRYRAGQMEVVGADTGSTIRAAVDAAAQGLGLEYAFTNSGLANSDGYSFYQAGIPTVFLFTGLHDEYHRPADDWWLLNAEGAAKLATLAARTVRALADADGRPAFAKVDRESMAMNRSSRVILGVVLEDAPGGKGALVQGVSPRSPAARAGIQQGDVVTSFGGREVKSADDLRAAIGYARPGDTLQAKLQRGDQGMDLPVTFPAPPGPVFGVTYDADGDGKGAAVQEVAKGSVAEAAKVQAGDRILSFNGKDVPDGKSLAAALRTAKPGTTVKVRVLREGKEVDLEATYPK